MAHRCVRRNRAAQDAHDVEVQLRFFQKKGLLFQGEPVDRGNGHDQMIALDLQNKAADPQGARRSRQGQATAFTDARRARNRGALTRTDCSSRRLISHPPGATYPKEKRWLGTLSQRIGQADFGTLLCYGSAKHVSVGAWLEVPRSARLLALPRSHR